MPKLTDEFVPWMEEALTQHAQGDEVKWDLSLTVGPEGPTILIGMWMKGPLIGSWLTAVGLIGPPPNINQEKLTGSVRELLEHLRTQRSEALTSAPVSNGGPPGVLRG